MAGNNRVQYTIGVNADTKQADAQLAKLSSTLDKIQKQAGQKNSIGLGIEKAAESAKTLKSALENAVNVDTGKLNLSKFNSSLKESGTSLQQLATNLINIGGEGSTAFVQLASSIAGAEVPIKRMNSTLANFATTLKNTVKWEISSKMVHGLESFLSGAISYAKDLNGTLNDIRVVTGASIADMGKFANQANQMAKELSATTQEIAKASLIYYQQGDNAELAAKKAAITTKAANVAFTASAQEMSQMLTAVWNSFQMGEDQLEHAVDVMAILGATTASSMEEMATAMQKVAATANNVGVSMEQMSAIVATSASVTRQAPQVIGTAWNTILSRLGGLKLGETLEDGVDLNKYSKALSSIGVQVLDATGNLRDMGGVVDEIGAKWNTMTRAQQSALAQTIGGTRQYTQILAFFDNFEKYQKNLETANNSEGALNKQAETYAQSWEAASKRQKAALQGVFRQVIDDEAIIKVTNSLTGLIERIGEVIKGFGGMQGVLLTLGNVAMKVFGNQMTKGLDFALSRVSNVFGPKNGKIAQAWNISKDRGQNQDTGEGSDRRFHISRFVDTYRQQGNYAQRQTRNDVQDAQMQLKNSLKGVEPDKPSTAIAYDAAQKTLDLKQKLLNTEYQMSEAQQKAAQQAIDLYGQEAQKLAELADKEMQVTNAANTRNKTNAHDIFNSMKKDPFGLGYGVFPSSTGNKYVDESEIKTSLSNYTQARTSYLAWENISGVDSTGSNLMISEDDWNNNKSASLKMLQRATDSFAITQDDAKYNEIQEYMDKVANSSDYASAKTAMEDLINLMHKLGTEGKDEMDKLENEIRELGQSSQDAKRQVEGALNDARADSERRVEAAREEANQRGNTDDAEEEARRRLERRQELHSKLASGLQKTAAAAMSATASFNAMQNTLSTLGDESASFAQKTTSILSTAGNLMSAWSQGIVSGIAATAATVASTVISIFEGVHARELALISESAERVEKQVSDLKENHEQVTQIKQQYEELKSAFEAGDLSRSEYSSKLGEITSSLDIEGTHVYELTQNYEKLQEAIENATNTRLTADVDEAKSAYKNTTRQGANLIVAESNKENKLVKFDRTAEGVKAEDILWRFVGQASNDAKLETKDKTGFYNWRTEQNLDASEAVVKMLQGDTLGEIITRKGNNGINIDLSEPKNAILVYERLIELRDEIALQDTSEGLAAADLVGNQIFTELLEAIEAYALKLQDTQAIIMEAVANKTLEAQKKTIVENYQNGSISREDLIQSILGQWENDATIDLSEYGIEDATKLATSYVDAFLNKFDEIAVDVNNDKAATNLKDQVFEYVKNVLGEDVSSDFINWINENWDTEFAGKKLSELFASNSFGNIDWLYHARNGDYQGAFVQELNAQTEYNTAASRYNTATNWLSRRGDVSAEDVSLIAQSMNFNEEDYAKLGLKTKAGQDIEDYNDLLAAVDSNQLDMLTALTTLFNYITENLQGYADEVNEKSQGLENVVNELTNEEFLEQILGITGTDYSTYRKNAEYVLSKDWQKQTNDQILQDEDLLSMIPEWYVKELINSAISPDIEEARQTGTEYRDAEGYFNLEKAQHDYAVAQGYLTDDGRVNYSNLPDQLLSSLLNEIQNNLSLINKREDQKSQKTGESTTAKNADNVTETKINSVYGDMIQQIPKLLTLKTGQIQVLEDGTMFGGTLSDADRLKFGTLSKEEQEEKITQAMEAYLKQIDDTLKETGETLNEEEQAWYDYYKSVINERRMTEKTASYKAAYEAFTIDLKDQQTNLTKMQSGANILLQNSQSGKLTNAQLNTLAQSGLGKLVEDYQTVATVQERLNIASQAYSQYLIQQEQYLTNQNSLYNEISGYIKHESRDFARLEKITDPDKFINNYFRVSKESKGLLENIMADVAKNKGYAKITDVPVQEMLAGIQEYCSKAISENQLAYNQMEADGKDAMQAIWKSAADEVSQAAQTAVDKWTKAFETISKARQKLLKGENILEDLINDPESYRIVAEQWYEKYGSYDGLNQALSSGQGLEFLQNPSFNDSIKVQQAQQGIDIIDHWMDKWGDRINLGEYRTSVIQDKRSQYFKDHPELDYDSEAWYASDEYKNAVGTADEIIKTQLLALLTYANQYTEQEANELIDRFFNHEDIGLNEIANKNSQLIALQAEGQNIVTTKTEAESANADMLENIQTAHEILSGVVSGSAKNEHWYDELKPAKFEELANVLGITEKQLRSWSLEQVQAKFLSLSSALDAASAAAKNFDKAVSAGAFNNKRVSGYTTSSGERIWDSDENKVVVQDHNKKGYDTYEEAFKEAQLGQQVVYGSDGKWHTIVGGETESAIVQQAAQEGKIQLEKESTTNQEEARATLSEAETETESEWISKRTAEFEKLEDLQKAVYNPKSSQDTIDNKWESLYKTLDMTIPAIQDAYDHMRTATEGTEEWDIALDELTTAIIKQGDVQIKDTEQLKIATKQWLNQCGITDKYGKQLNALSIQAIRASNNTKTLSKAVEFLGTVSKKAAGDEGTDDLRENLETLRKQAKKTGKEFDKYVDDLDDLTDAEKEAVKETNKFYEALDTLATADDTSNVDEQLANIIENAEDMDSAIDGVLKSLANYSADDAITNSQDMFIQLADALSEASDEAKVQIKDQIGNDAAEIEAFCRFVGDQLSQCGDNWSQIDWGKMDAKLEANLSDPITLLTKLIGLASTMSNIPWLKVPGNLLGALKAALSQAQSIQGKHGGGGSSAKNEKPKSSGGGGGGGGDKTKKSLEKMQEDEKERYHEITKRIDEQSKALSKLDKIKSAAFGADRIKAINDEITALKKEKILYQELATEANHNLATNRSALAGFGATFNSDGTVNYDEFMNKIRREYNEAIEEYNDTDKEDQKKAKIDLDYAKERYEKAKKALEDYEEDMEKVQDAEENLLDIINQISAKTLEEIEYKIEVKFDINDRDIKYMQYLRNKWEDVLDKADESMEQMINEAKEYEDNLSVLQTANNDLYKQYNEGNLTAADFAEGLKEINDKSIEMLENLITIKKSIKEAYGNALETANDELEKHTAVLEHSYSMMEKYIQIQQLIGMGTDYTGLKQMYEFQYKSSLASVEAAKLYLDVLKDEEVALQAQIDAYGWTEVLKQQWEDLQERIRDGEDDLAEKTNQTLTTAQNAFSNAIKSAIEKFDEFVFGVRGGLSKLEADYQYYQEEQERYLSTSKELYEVAKLNREINGSLDEVTSQLTKTRLRELQEEIKSLSEKNRLTEYDVQMLELQYKYALALEDLEDKKNAKSIVRLTRDDNGNYGYQYTADSDEIDKAAQQVDDVLQQINELAANRTAEIEQAAISAQRNYYDNLEQISNDTSLSIEERQARIEELTQRYAETMQFNQEQYNNATNALLTNQEYVYKRYGTSIMENTGMIQDQMNSAITAMINKTDDWSAYLSTQLQPGGEIYEALETYKQQLDETNISAGLGNRQQAVQNMTKSIDDLTEANEAADEAIRNIADTLDDTLKNINAQTVAWQELTGSIQEAIDAYEKLAQTSGNKIAELGENVVNTGVGGEEVKTKSKNVYTYTWIDEHGIMHPGEWSYDSYSSAMEGASQNIKAFYSSYLTAGEDDAETAANKAKYDSLVDAALGTRSAPSTQVATFLRGGMIDFTGPAWVDGSTSSPESILNAGDTAKMLRMTELIHNIDLEALRMLYESINQSAIGMMYPLNGLLNSQSINPFATELQQHVTITAEFPNATDHSEIEQAFEDIVNLAAQYAGRK